MANSIIGVVVQAPRGASIGYIAGTSPDGLLTVNSAPASRTIDLFERLTRLWVRQTRSRANGVYQFDGLPIATVYDVIGRDDAEVYNDAIVSRVTPHAY